jgi:predicted membrane channel-forming protein YqfA (hemolysin III family)
MNTCDKISMNKRNLERYTTTCKVKVKKDTEYADVSCNKVLYNNSVLKRRLSTTYASGEIKPYLRGASHALSVILFPIYAYFLLDAVENSYCEFDAWISSVVFLLCTTMCFGFSAAFHVIKWSLEAESVMQKLDHSAIFLLRPVVIHPPLFLFSIAFLQLHTL